MTDSMLNAALGYAQKGFPIFPLSGKKPAIAKSKGGNGVKDATTDEAKINQWWTDYPDANIGVACGSKSGVWALDVDTDKGGEDSLINLVKEYGDLPKTIRQNTGGGGFHLLFKWSGEAIRNRSGDIGDGLDTRGEGGYIVAPPSIHPETGAIYQWHNTRSPMQMEALGAPFWLTEMATTSKHEREHKEKSSPDKLGLNIFKDDIGPYVRAALENECQAISGAKNGEQETTLNNAALSMGGLLWTNEISESEVFGALVAAGLRMTNHSHQDKWTRAAIEAKVRRGLDDGSKTRREIPTTNQMTKSHGTTSRSNMTANDWAEPLDIFGDASLSGSPSLPNGILPAVLEVFAVDKAERLGVDPSMIVLPALAVCAASLDDRYQIQPRVHDHEWRESARLWIALVEEAGGKKTPAINAATSPLNQIEKRWALQDDLTREARVRERKIYDVKLKRYAAAAAKGNMDKPPEAPPEYFAKRRVVSDATIEALSDILRGNPSGVLAIHDELSGWIGSFDAYKGKTGGRDRALWLELYNGGAKPIDRVSRGRVLVPNWSVSIVGGIQPGPMKRIVGNLSDDGLLQRFIVVHGKQAGPGVDRLPNESAMRGYTSAIENLIAAQTDVDVVIKLSEGAQVERSQVINAVEALKLLPDTSPAFKAHLNKWEALFARIALTFHAVETIGTTGGAIPCEVTSDTAARVAQFMLNFLLPNAARFYSDFFGAEGQIENARWIAGYILSRQLEKISFRDIGRAYRKVRDDKDSIQAAMDALVLAEWVEPLSPDRGERTKRWTVNPAVHVHFTEKAATEKIRRENERTLIQEATRTLGLANKGDTA